MRRLPLLTMDTCRVPDFRSPDTGLYANLAHLDIPGPVRAQLF